MDRWMDRQTDRQTDKKTMTNYMHLRRDRLN